MVGALALGLELAYNEIATPLPLVISVLNWSSFMFLIIITCSHQRCSFLHVFVCPVLTILSMLYISYVDYDMTFQSIYYS